MKAISPKESAELQRKYGSDSERELALARAIIQNPEQHEDATFKAACKLLGTVGIATDRRNAEIALRRFELRALPAEQDQTPPALPAKPFAKVDGLQLWAKALFIAGVLLTLVALVSLMR